MVRTVGSAVIFFGLMAAGLPAGVVSKDSLREGPDASWTVSHGSWDWTERGLSNGRHGENRIFRSYPELGKVSLVAGAKKGHGTTVVKDVLRGRGQARRPVARTMDFAEHALGYQVSFSAMLDNGPGWGLFFNSRVDRSNRVSGYTFQYDPGYGRGAYLLRRWVNNRESVIKAVSASLDYDVSHTFTLDITPGSLSISQDGGEVLAYTGNLPVQGDVLGFRTWGSTDATFQNVAVQSAGVAGSVPEPTTLCLLGLGGLLLVRRPVRVQSG